MRAFLASALLVLATASLGLVSPLVAEPYKSSALTAVQKRKFYIFGFVAGIRCQIGKSMVSQSVAQDIISDEVTANDFGFLKDKKVAEHLTTVSQYLYDNSEKCDIPDEKMVNDNMKLFKDLAKVITNRKTLPQVME